MNEFEKVMYTVHSIFIVFMISFQNKTEDRLSRHVVCAIEINKIIIIIINLSSRCLS